MRPCVSLAMELKDAHGKPICHEINAALPSFKKQIAPPKYETHSVPSPHSIMVCAAESKGVFVRLMVTVLSAFKSTIAPRSICTHNPPLRPANSAATPRLPCPTKFV